MRNEATAWAWSWRRCARVALALALIGIAWPSRAAEIYRIDGVPVDATAESAVAAREIAIADGTREGLARLMRRLTAPSDHARLPSVAGMPVERFVNSYEIAEERVAPTRYMATLNISYVAAEVQEFLYGTGIPFVTRRSDPILVVPVEQTPDGPSAWLETSVWRTAWYEALEQATVAVLVLPLADLADVAAAPPTALVAGDEAVLENLAQRYGAVEVVVAQAALERSPETGRFERVTVTARGSETPDRLLVQEVVPVTFQEPVATLEPAAIEEQEAQTLQRAAGLVVAAIEDEWKRRTLVPQAAASRLVAAVPLADLAGWVQIRNELAGLPEVHSLEVESFSRERARLAIGFDGDLARLAMALERVGLSLVEENDGWHLRPAAGPAGYPAPFSAPPPLP